MGRLNPTRPMHSWLHAEHTRGVPSPDRAVTAWAVKSGSAICPRTTPTRSQAPSRRADSASLGRENLPTPTTGRATAARSADGMCSA